MLMSNLVNIAFNQPLLRYLTGELTLLCYYVTTYYSDGHSTNRLVVWKRRDLLERPFWVVRISSEVRNDLNLY